MLGGNLEDRLRPAEAESRKRLERLGFSEQPPGLSWTDRMRIVCGATEAVVHLHAHKLMVRQPRHLPSPVVAWR